MRCGVVDGEEYVSDMLDAGRDMTILAVEIRDGKLLNTEYYDGVIS